MAQEKSKPFIRNIAEVPWREFPDHFGGALSKPLVMPETAGSRHLDYRISMYQPMARVALHKHKVQEQVYHVLDGEGLMEIDGKHHVVRKHDVIFLPPGVEHSIANTGLVDLVFLVATSPVVLTAPLVTGRCAVRFTCLSSAGSPADRMGEIMRKIVLALVALFFAAVFAAPQAAETRVKKKRYYANAKTYAAQSRKVDDDGYYERIADKLPVGTSRWWHQMDFENRGGR